MKHIWLFAILFALITLLVPVTLAQENKAEETIMVKKSELPPGLLTKLEAQASFNETKEKITQYGNWVGMGKEIGIAVNDGITAIKDQAISLSETKLGYYIMFLIAYKVIGTDLIQLAIGLPLMIALFIVFLWSYYKNCIPRQVLVEEDKGKKVYKTFPFETTQRWNSSDMAASQIMHFVFFAISMIACIAIIFV